MTRRQTPAVPANGTGETCWTGPAGSMRGSGRGWAALLVIVAVSILIRVPALIEPWGADQSVFAFIAHGMLEGKVPYRDLYSSTGYGIFFLYAGLFRAFGDAMIVLHLADLAAALVTVLCVWAAARRIAGPRAGLAAAALQGVLGAGISFSTLYEMATAAGPYWALAQRESFMAPLLAGSLLVVLDRGGDRPVGRPLLRAVVSGVLVGLAAVLKLTAVLFLPVLLIAPLVMARDARGLSDGGRAAAPVRSHALALLAGFGIAQIPFLGYFISHGALGAMASALFLQGAAYAGLSRGARVETFVCGHAMLLGETLPVWALALAGGARIVRGAVRGNALLALLSGLAALLSVWGQMKFFGYHFLVLMPFLCILAGIGFEGAMLRGRPVRQALAEDIREPYPAATWALLGVFLFLFVGGNYVHLRWDVLRLAGRLTETQHIERFNEYPRHFYSARANREVALYLRQTAPAGASLRAVNDGGDLVVFHWAPLSSPTRFTSSWYLFNQALLGRAATRALRREFIEETIRARPDYLLLVYYALEDWPRIYPLDTETDIRMFYEFIRDGYRLEKRFRDGRDLYRRL